MELIEINKSMETASDIAYLKYTKDPGPETEFEKAVGTKAIVAKYQHLIYKDDGPLSDSSDEPF